MLELAGLATLVEERVDADVIRTEGLRARPAPDLLLLACRRLGVQPEEAVTFTHIPPAWPLASRAGWTSSASPRAPEASSAGFRRGARHPVREHTARSRALPTLRARPIAAVGGQSVVPHRPIGVLADAAAGRCRDARASRPTEGGAMQRSRSSRNLRPGSAEQAEKLIELGPPFDPIDKGLERHMVFLAADTVVFVFEGDDPQALLAAFTGLPSSRRSVRGSRSSTALRGSPARPTPGSARSTREVAGGLGRVARRAGRVRSPPASGKAAAGSRDSRMSHHGDQGRL